MQISLSISTSNLPYFLPPQEPTSEFLSSKYPFSTFRRGVIGTQKISVGNHGGGRGGGLFTVKGSGFLSAVDRVIEEEQYRKAREQVHRKGMDMEGYLIEGCSIGGHETCIVIPRLNCAFDIGRCPTRAIHQDFLFITHAHLDHIGGLPMYVATRGLYGLKPPTIFVPPCIKEDVEKLFDIHRNMSRVDLQLDLVALEVGDTYEIRNDLVPDNEFLEEYDFDDKGYWKQRKLDLSSTLLNTKTIVIQGFQRCDSIWKDQDLKQCWENEMEFVQFLLKNSKVLEKMEIEMNKETQKDVELMFMLCQTLTGFPRASPNARLFII